MVREPLARRLPSFVAQPAEQAPFGVQLRPAAELRHQGIVADPVNQHAAVFGPVQLTIVDQPGREGDRISRIRDELKLISVMRCKTSAALAGSSSRRIAVTCTITTSLDPLR